MKKTRVYELAKEFRKDTKELLDLIHEMGIEAASHASSLSTEDASRIRERLQSEKTHEVVDKRISTGVIRRRKKAIKKVETEAAPEGEAAQAAPEAVVEKPVPAELPVAEEAIQAAEPVAEPAAVPTEEPSGGEEVAETAAEEAEATIETEPAEAQIEEPGGEPAAAEVTEATEAVEPDEKPKPAKKTKPKRPAKWSESEPARIISKPSRPMTPAEVGGAEPARFRRGPVPPIKVEDDLGGKGKRRKGKGALKKKGRRRDVSRDELYEGRQGKFRASKMKRSKKAAKTQITQPKAIKMRIKVAEAITVAELAKRMGVKATDVIKQLMGLGMMVTLSQTIDIDTATLVAAEFGYEVERTSFEEADLIKLTEDKPEDLKPRPPVVTIMGHVDHGKSSLLEAISAQDIDIVSGEAGGITQHIGAYVVRSEEGDIVFLDTPGHEAFTAMRARGAQVTDIVVLVVAADDGVMEQTREAVSHAQAAKVPIIVAVNKMDKPDVDPERVRRELTEIGLQPEDWGGDTLFAEVSAKTGQGIDQLLEAIRLQADLLELKANPDKPAVGRIVEAQLDKGRGPVATVLIQGGTLKIGDAFVVGAHYGKVRALMDDRGQPLDSAGPSTPVQVLGLSGVPEAGDELVVVEDEKHARQISDYRAAKRRETELSQTTRMSLESFMEKAAEGEVKELPIVIKADVQGSVEALRDALARLSTDKVKLSVIHTGVGAITESDVMLAAASNAIIVAFNVRANPKAAEVMETEGVEVRYYDVIYKAIEEIREAMEGLLDSLFKEHTIGRAEVRETFKVPRVGTVAGCAVTDGVARRNALARLVRDGVVIFDGKLASLKRFKDDVKEVAAGYECGIGLEGFNDIKVGDVIEMYELEEIRPSLED